MKKLVKILVVNLMCLAWFACSPVKYSGVDVSSSMSPANYESGAPDPGPLPQPSPHEDPLIDPLVDQNSAPAAEPPANLPPDLITQIPEIDNQAGPLFDSISQADPEFKASDVFYFKFAAILNLFGVTVQKKYTAEPESCKLSAAYKILIIDFGKTRDLEINKCSGFQRASQVAAANGGSCTPQVGTQKNFKLGMLIDFDRTTELSADCKCFRLYQVKTFNGLLTNYKVLTFADNETCAAEFPETKLNN
jgi:hypothetical protein